MSERVVKVSLTMQVSNYLAGAEQVRKANERTGKSAEDVKARLEEQNRAMEAMGRGMVVAGALAVTASVLATKAAIGWESAWAGVTKTVEGTPEQLAQVEAGLRGLTKVLPAAHDEIAAVAEAAGQLGIKTGSVVAFTRTMIDLGETTNLSANEAATSLARFMNVMGTSQGQVSNLGSAIVELGNNYATTEAEIVAMSLRLSGAGRQIGLTEGEVLGLATALSSVGIEAEAGGSAISKVMIDIASSVDKGGDRLALFSKVSGVSADDFAAKWKSAPGAALALFVKGLADADKQGGSTLGTLEELGITEVRMRDALLRSAAASDQFTKAMDTGNRAMDENTALTDEAAKRYATLESKIEITRNKVVDASIDFGQVFLPVVSAMADAVGGLADAFGDMPQPLQSTVAGVTALGGVTLLVGGAFLLAIPKIAMFQTSLAVLATSQIPAVAAAAVGMQTAIARATTGMAATARFLTGPWGVALAAAGVGVALLTKFIDDLKASTEEYQNTIKNAKTADDLFKVSDKGRLISELDDATSSAGAFQEQLNKISTNAFLTGLDLSAQQLKQSMKDLGSEIATTAQSDLPSAQRAFRLLADEMELNADQQLQLLDSMPAYKDALIAQATELGINVTSSNEAANKTNLLKLAFGSAESGALSAADAYLAAADETAALDNQLQSLLDTLNEANGVGQDAVSTNAAYQASLAEVAEAVKNAQDGVEGYALGIDETTAAGSANADMLRGLASDSQAAAKAQFDLDGNTDKYKATLGAGRDAIIKQALALGASADEAENLANKIYAIPTTKQFKMIAETDAAAKNLQKIQDLINGIGATSTLHISTAPGRGGMTFASGGFTGSEPRDAIVGAVHGQEFVTHARATAIPSNRAALEHMHRGGVIRGYASGGFVSGRDVQYASQSRGYFSAPTQTKSAPSGPMQISGTMDLGNGLTGFVKGVITEQVNAASPAMYGGKA